jgi:glucan phosphoethanolaminetransferase (alkaline phosphatase superfamily)
MKNFNYLAVDSNLLTVFLVFVYVVAVITLQALASVCVIVTALSTLALNIYKIVMDKRDRKKNQSPPKPLP